MQYRNLGSSGLKVSEIGLGANNFGWRIDEQASISIINQALELGVTFIDTADEYARGVSEEFIGKAVKGKRSQVIIASKFWSPQGKGPNERGGSRYHIIEAVEASLRRLKTDYIDLYQMHKPDPTTPIEETLRTLDTLVKAGKVRYIGCSNFAGWQLSDALWTSRVNHLESFVTVQSEYSLLDRSLEEEVVPCCQAHGLGVIPYWPLACGFLTGKFHRGEPLLAGTRIGDTGLTALLNDANFDFLDKLQAFAKEHSHTVGELAIAWVLSHSWVSTVIAGATKNEQLSANVASAEWKLTSDDLAKVDSILTTHMSVSINKYRQRH